MTRAVRAPPAQWVTARARLFVYGILTVMSTSSWRRHARAAVTVHPFPGRWPVALKAALTILLVLGGSLALGDLRLGMLASLGTFTVIYGPTTAARYRFRLMLAVGAGLVTASFAGALVAGDPVLTVLTLTAIAAVATFLCVTLSVGPPGAFFFCLVPGVAGLAAGHGTPVGLIVGAAAVGAVVAMAVGMSDLVVDPSRPERRAVETAEAAMDRFEAERDREELDRVRHAASSALHAAWTVVTDAGSHARWTRRLWTVQDRYAAATARVTGGLLGIDPSPWGTPGEETSVEERAVPEENDAQARRVDVEQIRDTSLGRPATRYLLRRAAQWPSEVLLVTARVVVGALVAGTISALLGVEHVYWTVAFTTLVLHQGGTREAQTVRALQRLGGTALGLGVFALLAAAGAHGWTIVVIVAVLQFLVEMLVVRNYGLAVIAITPLALTIGSHASGPRPPGPLIAERALDTVIAVVVALAVLRLVGRNTHVTLLRGYARSVVLAIDAVLADLAAGRIETREARADRRRLYHALLESAQIARRTDADDPGHVADYHEMERTLSRLGYLVLGLAWHPDTRAARGLSEQARAPLARILDHSVRGDRPAGDIHADVRAVADAVTTWRPADDRGPAARPRPEPPTRTVEP